MAQAEGGQPAREPSASSAESGGTVDPPNPLDPLADIWNAEDARRAGLRWLAGLRWWALTAGMFGVLLSVALSWTFINTPAVVLGLAVMVAINGVLLWRTHSEARIGKGELLLHATADLLMLTWLLTFAGGIRNPLVVAYAFHVVIGTLLSGRRGALISTAMSLVCLGLLWGLEELAWLPVPPLHEPPALLQVVALVLLLVGLGFLALELAEQQARDRARAIEQQREAEGTLGLLLEMLGALRVGVDMRDVDNRPILQNDTAATVGRAKTAQQAIARVEERLQKAAHATSGAAASTGAAGLPSASRVTERFALPAVTAARDSTLPQPAAAEPGSSPPGPASSASGASTAAATAGGSSDERVFELVALSPTHPKVARALLYVDRTESLMVEQRHVMLERLATLGRAMQGVAHELNTPLTTMQTLAKDLRAALGDVELPRAVRVDVEESLGLLIEESRRCRVLTQSLLATANDGSLSRGRQRLFEVAKKAVRVVGADDVSVELDDKSLMAAGDVDADRVLQILMNLIQNALAATVKLKDDGQGPRVTVAARHDEQGVVVLITDRGPGLPAEVRERLFEPFVTTKSEGTGLGLYTCQQLAHELGGGLELVDAPEGTGTQARLTLSRGA